MADLSGTNLKEPEQINWDTHNKASKFQAPPVPVDATGKLITYFGQVPTTVSQANTDGTLKCEGKTPEGLIQFTIDPIRIVRSGNGADGYELRFSRVSTKQFKSRKTGEPLNMSSASMYVASAGITSKPQKNAEYRQAVKQSAGRNVSFNIDWSAYNKETGERVDGYELFPFDPDRPGQRKCILRQGDVLTDGRIVQSEVLFANARVSFFRDPNRK